MEAVYFTTAFKVQGEPYFLQYFSCVNRPIPSSLVPLFQNESTCESEFCMQFQFHANQSHFHKNGFALRLALKQRHENSEMAYFILVSPN